MNAICSSIVCCVIATIVAASDGDRAPGSRAIDQAVARFNQVFDDPRSTPAARREVLQSLRHALQSTPPPQPSDRERDLLRQRSENNELARHTLVSHFVIALATDRFAERARQNQFMLVMDMAYVCLKHFWGNDPIARAGNRFIIHPQPDKPGGHSCSTLALQIAVGRADADNADWFERFFHEMTHGFQRDHPAGCYMQAGFYEGFAEFCQAVVCDYLSPLGQPFEGRFQEYSREFPNRANIEYLTTRLPIEEIIAYDPSSGLLMELTNTTLDRPNGRPDWTPMRALLQTPLKEPRWVPAHLWPALMARDCTRHFGVEKARPILAKYRFPLDERSLREVEELLRSKPAPLPTRRTPIVKWRVLGPIPNPKGMGIEWNPLDVENLALDPSLESSVLKLPDARGLTWRSDVRCDSNGRLHLRDDWAKDSEFYCVTGEVPTEFRNGPVTFFVSSDDDVALYLNGKLIHLFRGSRGCEPEYPDIAYALVNGPGRLVALVVNHGGPGGFSCAIARGTPIESANAARLKSAEPAERIAAIEYLASRRFVEPLTRDLLLKSLDDVDAKVRAAATRGLAGMRNDVEIVDALYARLDKERDEAARIALLDSIYELTFTRPILRVAQQTWQNDRPRFASSHFVEAEIAWRMGTINAGFFGNHDGAYGNQCVNRGWGSDPSHFFTVVVEARQAGEHRIRFRYAHPHDNGRLTVRLRRGPSTVIERPITLPRTKDWTVWRWHEIATPPLEAGRHYIDFIDPHCTPIIDVVGLQKR